MGVFSGRGTPFANSKGMGRGHRLSLLTLCLAALGFGTASSLAQTANSQGLIGSAGQFSRDIGQAAASNRQVADQLLQQALADEKKALSTFPPSIGLLAKAGLSALDGMRADDQAKSFAQSTLHAINTGEHSGQFNAESFGARSPDQIRNLATTNSAYRGEVQSRLASWGIKMSENGSSFELPLGLGSVSTSIGYADVEKGMRTAARLLGYNPEEVSSGLQEAVRAREAIVARAQLQSGALAGGEASALSGGARLPSRETGGWGAPAAGGKLSAAESVGAREITNAGLMTLDFSEDKNIEVAVREAELAKFRGELQKKLGLPLVEVRGTRDQDLFQMVHVRYQLLREIKTFIESDSLRD